MSYADMITILMAFFVVMYSMAGSSKDKDKEDAVMKSLRDRFGPNWHNMVGIGDGPYVPKNSMLAQMVSSGGGKQAKKNQGKGEARASNGDHPRVHTLRPGEQTAIGGSIQFTEGKSAIDAEMLRQLELTAAELSGKPQRIEVRGHTSRRPVPKGSEHRDNWDLAYARCRATMEKLVELGIDPRRIRLGVSADNEPKLRRDDSLVREQSGRVEVFMLNEILDSEADRKSS